MNVFFVFSYRAFRCFSFKLCLCSGDSKKHVRSRNFRFLFKKQFFGIAIIFLHHITFVPIFFGDPTLSEKPKNGIKNCDFDFGWSKFWSEPSCRLSKIQKSTFQSLDSDRSLGPGQRLGGSGGRLRAPLSVLGVCIGSAVHI